MIVSVTDDPVSDNNGTYVLNDSDGSLLNNWDKVASTTVTNLVYSGNTLTLTMSDGSEHTVTIDTAASSTTTATGQVGASSVARTIGGFGSGILTFTSETGG